MKNYSKIEAILYKYKYMQTDIDLLDVEIEEIKNNVIGVSSINYDGMPKCNDISSSIENELINKEKMIANLTYKRRKLQLQKEQIDITLELMNDDLKRIFYEKYNKVGKINVEKLCRKMCISRDKYYKDKNKLIETFAEIL